MKLTKLLKALSTASAAVAELKAAGVRVPKKLEKQVDLANAIGWELNKALATSSSRLSSNQGGK